MRPALCGGQSAVGTGLVALAAGSVGCRSRERRAVLSRQGCRDLPWKRRVGRVGDGYQAVLRRGRPAAGRPCDRGRVWPMSARRAARTGWRGGGAASRRVNSERNGSGETLQRPRIGRRGIDALGWIDYERSFSEPIVLTCGMSGSGSSYFGLCRDRRDARRVVADPARPQCRSACLPFSRYASWNVRWKSVNAARNCPPRLRRSVVEITEVRIKLMEEDSG